MKTRSMIRQTMPDGFERCVSFRPAFDHRETPGKERYGQHVAEIHFGLVGPYGAVSLRIFTGWLWSDGDPASNAGQRMLEAHDGTTFRPAPMAAALTLHQPPPTTERAGECEYLSRCAFRVLSFSAGEDVFAVLVRSGEEPFWTQLRALYDDLLAEPARAGAH